MDLTERLKAINCDVDEAIRRFNGRKETYIALVKSFPADSSLSEYCEAFDLCNYDEAYLHIHNLKGLSASFGFSDLYSVSSVISNAIRNKDYEYASRFSEELHKQYELVVKTIQEMA